MMCHFAVTVASETLRVSPQKIIKDEVPPPQKKMRHKIEKKRDKAQRRDISLIG